MDVKLLPDPHAISYDLLFDLRIIELDHWAKVASISISTERNESIQTLNGSQI